MSKTEHTVVKQESRLTLRLPANLKESLQERAIQNNRSLNGEIVATLAGRWPSMQAIADSFKEHQ